MNFLKFASLVLLAAWLSACATESASTTTSERPVEGKNCEFRTGSNICRR